MYASVSALANDSVPTLSGSIGLIVTCLDEAMVEENSWVKHALTLVEKEL